MRHVFGLIIRCVVIVVVFGSVGLATNMLSSKSLPLIYEPSSHIEVSGVRIPLVNEHVAHDYFGDPTTSFVDTRQADDYSEGHVKGSVFLTPDNVVEAFPDVQPLLPQENRIVLYCYGPECDMAEQVAKFMIDLGYRNLVIMSSGFRPWEAAGYPVEGPRSKERSKRSKLDREKR
jgi:rhodanese-related sulfurtransferase